MRGDIIGFVIKSDVDDGGYDYGVCPHKQTAPKADVVDLVNKYSPDKHITQKDVIKFKIFKSDFEAELWAQSECNNLRIKRNKMKNFSKRSLNSKDKISKTKDYIIKLIRSGEDQDYIDYAMKCFRRSYEPLSKKDWIAEGKVDEEILNSMEVFSKENQEINNFSNKWNNYRNDLRNLFKKCKGDAREFLKAVIEKYEDNDDLLGILPMLSEFDGDKNSDIKFKDINKFKSYKNFSKELNMKNFNEKLNKLQESVGLEKTNFSDKYEYQCPCHHTRSNNPEEVCPVCKMKVKEIIKSKDKNFTEENIDIDVKDEASAREYGETLAKNTFGDKFDQKIFDGVFASALEECGENWDAVANYLKNCYTGSNKNFSENKSMKNFSERLCELQESVGLDPTASIIPTQTPAESTTPSELNDNKVEVTSTMVGDSQTADNPQVVNLSENPKNKPEILSKKDAELVIKLNDEAQTLLDKEDEKSEIRLNEIAKQIDELCNKQKLPDYYRYNVINLVKVAKKILSGKNFADTPAVLEEKPKDTTPTPEEANCPACGKKLILNFEALSDDEVNEIATEAQEITQYPEQYETESDQVHAFCDWLQNSRFKDFCDEAIFRAFCGLKK